MQMPTFDQLFNPVLLALTGLGGSASLPELTERVTADLKLPKAIIEQPHPSNNAISELNFRLSWARTYLKKYGLITNSARGVWVLTAEGQNVREVSPKDVVKHVQDSLRARGANPSLPPDGADVSLPTAGMNSVTAWSDELSEILQIMAPQAFERLCQRLLRESGFMEVKVTGQSGDGGIDGHGILRLAGVLSFRVVFQCKRYQKNVTPSTIRDFRGAIMGRAERGLLITTSGFTSDAIKEAVRDGALPIDLIDGEEFKAKLKEFGLGVSTKQVEEVQIDRGWFASLQ